MVIITDNPRRKYLDPRLEPPPAPMAQATEEDLAREIIERWQYAPGLNLTSMIVQALASVREQEREQQAETIIQLRSLFHAATKDAVESRARIEALEKQVREEREVCAKIAEDEPEIPGLMPTYPIVGARYRPPAQAVLDNLPAGTKLLLRRQPDNPYDGNAVQVLLAGDGRIAEESAEELYGGTVKDILLEADVGFPLHLGFIPREAASKLAPLLDSTLYDDSSPAEWPATLTFAAHGGPMVTFEQPQAELEVTEYNPKPEAGCSS